MAVYEKLTREIDKGPSGPKVGAFFDLDRTLLAGFSVFAFVRDLLRAGKVDGRQLVRTLGAATRFQIGDVGFSGFLTETAGVLKGVPESDLEQLGEKVFAEQLAANVYPESRALVRAHQRKGHTVAVVSSATRYQIEPLARDLGIAHVLCTRLEVKDGRFTGNVIRPTCYGPGKALAAREFAAAHDVDLSQSYFYTDSEEDLPLLDIVGRPRPTNPNATLKTIAAKRGWPERRFTSRGVPGANEIVRTSLTIGSLIPSLLLGLPAAILNRDTHRAMNVALATWGELGTALAGIELRVEGEEHLWSHRPAVFIFNHQSAIDVLLLCKLLRRDVVGIAKQELRRNPLFGPAFAMAGTVFIDRFHHDQAVKALEPAIDALRHGLSIAIAPEGTRSPTLRLGRFKKGAFHLALAAKAPIVPIVFKNALDVLPKHGIVIRPATVEVVVHPPIFTKGWTKKNLDGKVEQVRELYVKTLEED
jgi:putative phosphoserine phosphatase/1-acylglycerol-3-phosphate O-acyltransferase